VTDEGCRPPRRPLAFALFDSTIGGFHDIQVCAVRKANLARCLLLLLPRVAPMLGLRNEGNLQ
jgi:hypothetical protein